jgi:hypothetical protein
MCQTSAVVAIGLVVLAPAELLLVSRFGSLMAALIGVGLLGNLVLLPQLLCGPLGRLFEPMKKKPETLPEIPMIAGTSSIASAPHEDTIPAPHIQPTDLPSKKRRTNSRRRRDAG